MERSETVLGPLFTAGVLLIAAGAVRRSWRLVGLGAAAIVGDRRLPAARRLNDALAERVGRTIEPHVG